MHVGSTLAYHPVNLLLRLGLEIVALGAYGALPLERAEGWYKWPLVVICPLTVGIIWNVFAVAGDRSRSGQTVVSTDGRVRLCLELVILFGGAAAIWASGYPHSSAVMAGLIIGHYAISFDRIAWLLQQRASRTL